MNYIYNIYMRTQAVCAKHLNVEMLKDDILGTIKTIKKLNLSQVKGNKDERKLLLRPLVQSEILAQLPLTKVKTIFTEEIHCLRKLIS